MKDEDLLIRGEEKEKKEGNLIATNYRVIKNQKGLWFGEVKDVNYDQLSGVSTGRFPRLTLLLLGAGLLSFTLIISPISLPILPHRILVPIKVFIGMLGLSITIIGLNGKRVLRIQGSNSTLEDSVKSEEFMKKVNELRLRYVWNQLRRERER